MMNAPLKKLLLGFFVALATCLGCVSPAHAVIYKGSWDPNFGADTIFPYLGWRGSANFILPAPCVGLTGICTAPGMQVQNAVVEFYDNRDPLTATVQTLQFGSNVLVNQMTVSTTSGITSLVGVDTGFFVPSVEGTATVSKYLNNDYFFHLFFSGNFAFLVYTDIAGRSPGCASFPEATRLPVSQCGISQEPGVVSFVQIPEPTTSALALIALAGLLGIRRRRR